MDVIFLQCHTCDIFCTGAFVAFGMSGCIPVIHHIITDGYHEAVNFAALGTLIPMALLYLAGALIYAARFPESVWPGKFDIWVGLFSVIVYGYSVEK